MANDSFVENRSAEGTVVKEPAEWCVIDHPKASVTCFNLLVNKNDTLLFFRNPEIDIYLTLAPWILREINAARRTSERKVGIGGPRQLERSRSAALIVAVVKKIEAGPCAASILRIFHFFFLGLDGKPIRVLCPLAQTATNRSRCELRA